MEELREIKFKRLLRNKETGEITWYYQMITPKTSTPELGEGISPSFFIDVFKVVNAEWLSPPLQYSGITVNGVDIYESDRVNNEVMEWLVVFNKGCFAAKSLRKDADPNAETHIALRAVQGFKYIGNIYEDKFKK